MTDTNFKLHPEQLAVYQSEYPIRVVNTDRQWGKTQLALEEALRVAENDGVCYFIVPTASMLLAVKYKFLHENGGRGHHPGGTLPHQVFIEEGRIIFTVAEFGLPERDYRIALTIFDEVDMMLPAWAGFRGLALLALGTDIPETAIPSGAEIFDYRSEHDQQPTPLSRRPRPRTNT